MEKKKFKTLTNAQVLEMLSKVKADVKDNFYDPQLHGFDIEARFKKAEQEIAAAKSQDEALLSLSAAVTALNNSHTRFLPPARPYGVDYGWLMQAIGDSCFVTAVRPDSDAAQKDLRPGDQITSINGVTVTREDLGLIEYSYRVVPQSGLRLQVKSPQGEARSVVAMAKVIPGQPVIRGIDAREWLRAYHEEKDRSRYYKVSDRVMVWKFPDFLIEPDRIDGLLDKIFPYDTLILDLRENPGGLVNSLNKFVGGFFDHDIHVSEMKGRAESTAEIAHGRRKFFKGKLIVLIDSRSSSAAEIFARVVQIEKRGIVIGDRSAGAVNDGKEFVHAVALDPTNVTQYRTRVAIASVIMNDGQTLEGHGVIPDEVVLPTADDLRVGRDPVLSRALDLAGSPMSPVDAGKIFPREWPKQLMPEIN